jgi:hypothetical protein
VKNFFKVVSAWIVCNDLCRNERKNLSFDG